MPLRALSRHHYHHHDTNTRACARAAIFHDVYLRDAVAAIRFISMLLCRYDAAAIRRLPLMIFRQPISFLLMPPSFIARRAVFTPYADMLPYARARHRRFFDACRRHFSFRLIIRFRDKIRLLYGARARHGAARCYDTS